MTTFTFATTDHQQVHGLSHFEAHRRLKAFASANHLDVHVHEGGWAGYAQSTAYVVGGDMLLDAVAYVRKTRTCARCGDVLPGGQSCGCFDNGGQ